MNTHLDPPAADNRAAALLMDCLSRLKLGSPLTSRALAVIP